MSSAASRFRIAAASKMSWQVRASIFAAIPAMLLMSAALLYAAPVGFDTDPDYAYLLNAINILHLRPPDLYVHPGTTVELVGAAVMGPLGLARNFGTGQSIQTDVLLHPEIYLVAIDAAVLAIQAAAVFLLGWQIWRFAGRILVPLVAQASLFLSTVTVEYALVNVAPEPLLLFSSVLVAALSVPFIFAEDAVVDVRGSWWLGAAIGFSLATKINALPLLFAILYIKPRSGRLVALAATIAAFFFFTLPISHQYLHIYRIYFGFATHTGTYGDGAAGLPSLEKLFANLILLISASPEMFIDLALCAIGLGVFRWSRARAGMAGARFFAISAAVLLAQIALVTKTPSVHYLMPAVGTCCLVNATAVYLFVGKPAPWRVVLPSIGAVLLLLGWSREFADARDLAIDRADQHRETQRLLQTVAASGCTTIYFYGAPAEVARLEFGDEWADNRYGAALAALYPGSLFYDSFGRDLESFGAMIGRAAEQERLASARCVYLVGVSLDSLDGGTFPKAATTFVAQVHSQRSSGFSVYELHRGADGAWPPLSRQP